MLVSKKYYDFHTKQTQGLSYIQITVIEVTAKIAIENLIMHLWNTKKFCPRYHETNLGKSKSEDGLEFFLKGKSSARWLFTLKMFKDWRNQVVGLEFHFFPYVAKLKLLKFESYVLYCDCQATEWAVKQYHKTQQLLKSLQKCLLPEA